MGKELEYQRDWEESDFSHVFYRPAPFLFLQEHDRMFNKFKAQTWAIYR